MTRRFTQRIALVTALICSGCWQSQQKLRPPELGDEGAEVSQTLERLERIGSTVDDGIADLRGRSESFLDAGPSTWSGQFPLDSFKHTAMSCLNAPYNEAPPEPQVTEAAERLALSCAVASALELEQRLQEAPQARQMALEKLSEVDQIRNLRSKLQSQLRQLPSIVRRTRAYLSARRAEARQMTKNVQQRKADYSRKSFEESLRRVEAYEAQLSELDRAIDVIEGSSGRWSKDLGSVVDVLYKGLSRLGRP